MPKSKKDSDDRPQETGPFNLPDIDESTPEQDDTSINEQEDTSTTEDEDMSRLKQHLDLVVGEAPGQPSDKPALTTKPNAYISEEVEKTLRGVVNVLETRYGTDFSKSLFVDYALRMVLLDVMHRAEKSEIVSWLDDTLE